MAFLRQQLDDEGVKRIYKGEGKEGELSGTKAWGLNHSNIRKLGLLSVFLRSSLIAVFTAGDVWVEDLEFGKVKEMDHVDDKDSLHGRRVIVQAKMNGWLGFDGEVGR
ncbi:hypothetical protein MA16_Dca018168 [Dendrobium catenatum]|uniref:Uncharacterized protein n=1 Tax=Dendrobium catenatum TaxID=906689 RepID=A0A2I0VSS8_9ASPA|nr:hypothetical protein MA16_Dca018168 [Dendrobium catenatum]